MTDEQTVEEKARAIGWAPKEEFRGDPAKWVDAETYVKKGEEFIPFLQASKRKLEGEVTTVRGEVAQLKTTLRAANEAIAALKEFNTEASRKQAKEKIVDLKTQIKEARTQNDVDTELDLQSELRETETALATADKDKGKDGGTTTTATNGSGNPPDYTQTPEWKQFLSDNPWFESNRRMRAVAVEISRELAESGALNSLTPAQRYAKVAEETLKAIPGASDARRRNADRVEGSRGGASGGGEGGGHTYADLPPDARAACDKLAPRLVGEGRAYKTNKEWQTAYCERYQW